MGKRIIAIDGNSLVNRAYYAIQRPMITKEGLYTHAVYGFISMLNKIIKDYEPDYMLIAFDRKAPTFRHEDYAKYKAGRKKMPPELAMQLPLLKEVLAAMNIKMLELDGFEADDIIGTIVKRGEEAGLEPLVITGDKDELQLASDITKIIITKKGISEFDIYSDVTMQEKYGFSAEQFIDYKGLMGDQSDNIPGVPGVGEKTARKLIHQFGSIENLIDNSNQITPDKLRVKIEENIQLAIMSKRLATINTKVPLEIDFAEFTVDPPDRDALISLYKKLEFNSFLNKLTASNRPKNNPQLKEADSEKLTSINPDLVIIATKEDFSLFRAALELEVEISSNEIQAIIKVFSDNNHKETPKVDGISVLLTNICFYINTSQKEMMDEFINVLSMSGALLVGHNLKPDYYALLCHGFKKHKDRQGSPFLFMTAFDTEIAQYLIEPDRSNYSIKTMMLSYFHEEILDEKEFFKTNEQLNFLTDQQIKYAEYGLSWCLAVRKLLPILKNEIDSEDMAELYYDIELPLIEVLAQMESYGFAVNKNELVSAGKALTSSISDISLKIYALAGEKFNINSPKQLGPILFDKLHLATGKKNKTGFSTGFDVLEKLKEEHEIIPLILEYRNLSKLNSTYVEGLVPLINKDGKIHANFQQTVAATGRISCTEPNLQNIPIRQEAGRKLRLAFIPESSEYVLVGADYSQIELRLLADMSGDETLIAAFKNGDDIHTLTAAKVFGVPENQVTSKQRSDAKAVNFGVIYGMSGFGLSTELNISRKEAEKYIAEYFEKYSKVKEFLDNLVVECKSTGFVTTIMNRKRIIHEINASNYMVRQLGERLAMNSPLQGSAADIIKIAMVSVYKQLKGEGFKSTMILQVHDELIIQTHRDEVNQVEKLLAEHMCNAVKLKVPLEVSIDVGNNWFELK